MTVAYVPDRVPLGHSRSGHYMHGWCSAYRGRSVVDELVAWRVWACRNLPVPFPEDGDRAPGNNASA